MRVSELITNHTSLIHGQQHLTRQRKVQGRRNNMCFKSSGLKVICLESQKGKGSQANFQRTLIMLRKLIIIIIIIEFAWLSMGDALDFLTSNSRKKIL